MNQKILEKINQRYKEQQILQIEAMCRGDAIRLGVCPDCGGKFNKNFRIFSGFMLM